MLHRRKNEYAAVARCLVRRGFRKARKHHPSGHRRREHGKHLPRRKRRRLRPVELFQIENILIERDRFLDVIDFDRDVIASVNLHAHFRIYIDPG